MLCFVIISSNLETSNLDLKNAFAYGTRWPTSIVYATWTFGNGLWNVWCYLEEVHHIYLVFFSPKALPLVDFPRFRGRPGRSRVVLQTWWCYPRVQRLPSSALGGTPRLTLVTSNQLAEKKASVHTSKLWNKLRIRVIKRDASIQAFMLFCLRIEKHCKQHHPWY